MRSNRRVGTGHGVLTQSEQNTICKNSLHVYITKINYRIFCSECVKTLCYCRYHFYILLVRIVCLHEEVSCELQTVCRTIV